MTKSSGSDHRRASSGRFIRASTGAQSGRASGRAAQQERGRAGSPFRSTKTGRYVTEGYGKSHPNTTVREK